MKKIYLFVVAAFAAGTLWAQELPSTCDATIAFKYCFDIETASTAASYELPYTYNYTDENGDPASVTFTKDNYTQPQTIYTKTDRGCLNTITLTFSQIFPPEGAAGGNNAKGFSVGVDANNKPIQVFFSQGNLLYRYTDGSADGLSRIGVDGNTQPGIFCFAEHQYDYIKIDNTFKGNISCEDVDHNPVTCDNSQYNNKSYRGYISTLPWGSSGCNDWYKPMRQDNWLYQPSSSNWSIVAPDTCLPENITGTYYDWGVYNPIENGGKTCETWRAMTPEEWIYLLAQRTDADKKLAKATITDKNGNKIIYGLVLLPDNWSKPDGVNFNSGWNGTPTIQSMELTIKQTSIENDYSYNKYTTSEWQLMEEAGAVFLPITHINADVSSYYDGSYYTTKSQTSNFRYGYILQFNNRTVNQSIQVHPSADSGNIPYNVRLVSDKIEK